MSRSSILKYYGEHQICFFYLCLEGEIARVELPIWVAQDKAALELTHSLILGQCRKGQGYPLALSEAHEQAVVSGADREQFWQLVRTSFVEQRLQEQVSAKSHSKRTRWL
jgi:NurA-like 5'-3' nuclease